MPGRRLFIQMLTIGVIASAIGVALCLWMDWFPEPAAEQAGPIDTLWDWLLIASVPFFILVMTVAIYSVTQFRARPGHEGDGVPLHGNTRLEVIWVTIPFIVVTVLAIYAGVVLADIEEKKPNSLLVRATAQQFTWHFEYPQEGGKAVKSDVLYLPVDRPVDFDLDAADVLHSFWVPEFRMKKDVVPGQTTHVRVTPTKEGVYSVVCAELCGLGHSTMRVRALVVSQERFDEWLAGKQGQPQQGGKTKPTAEESPAEAGKAIFTGDAGCGACHKLSDAGTSGAAGPDLDQLIASAEKNKEGDQTVEEYIRESITDPDKVVVKGFAAGTMPGDFEQRLSGQEIDALVDYLAQAGGGK